MMYRNVVLNMFLSLLWPALNGRMDARSMITGFVLGFLVISIVEPEYGKRVLGGMAFTVYVLLAILESNLRLAWIVVQPRPPLDPGIVAIPLTVTTDLEITLLASIITLTPGTLSVDLREDSQGRKHLLVHSLQVKDREAFRREIKERFEQRLLAVTRGTDWAGNATQAQEEE